MTALLRYVLRRLLFAFITLIAVVTITFFLFRAVPGDPSLALIGPDLDPSVQDSLREQFGLNEPLGVQFIKYIANVAQGNFGVSFTYRIPVIDLLTEKLLNTAILVLPAIVISLVLGSLLGALAAWRSGSRLDHFIEANALAVRAMPVFLTGTFALMIFGYWLDLVPFGGMRQPDALVTGGFLSTILSLDFLWHLATPLILMTWFFMAYPLLTMRVAMKGVLADDSITFLEATGIPRWKIVRHAARNSMLPVVSLLSSLMGNIIGGQVLVEVVFSWPGMGRQIVESATNFDYPVLQAVFLLTTLAAVVMNTLVDIAYAYLDPRVSLT